MLSVSGSGDAPIQIWSSELITLVLETSWCHEGSFRVKSPRFVPDDDDAGGRRFRLKEVVVELLFVSLFRGKTFVQSGLNSDDA